MFTSNYRCNSTSNVYRSAIKNGISDSPLSGSQNNRAMAFNQFEEEYLDFFGDEESYEALRSKVQTVIFARKDECKHALGVLRSEGKSFVSNVATRSR